MQLGSIQSLYERQLAMQELIASQSGAGNNAQPHAQPNPSSAGSAGGSAAAGGSMDVSQVPPPTRPVARSISIGSAGSGPSSTRNSLSVPSAQPTPAPSLASTPRDVKSDVTATSGSRRTSAKFTHEPAPATGSGSSSVVGASPSPSPPVSPAPFRSTSHTSPPPSNNSHTKTD
jgi:hypothetical protein